MYVIKTKDGKVLDRVGDSTFEIIYKRAQEKELFVFKRNEHGLEVFNKDATQVLMVATHVPGDHVLSLKA